MGCVWRLLAPPKALLFLSSFWVPVRAAGSLARPCVHRPLNMPPRGHEAQWTVLVVTHHPGESPDPQLAREAGDGGQHGRGRHSCAWTTPRLPSAQSLLRCLSPVSPGTLPGRRGLSSGVGLATSRLCDSEQVSTFSGPPSVLLKGGVYRADPHCSGGKVHRYG